MEKFVLPPIIYCTDKEANEEFYSGLYANILATTLGDNFNGVMISGLVSFVKGELKGLQAAGIFSCAGDDAKGIQISGLVSFVDGQTSGMQMSGLCNYVKRNENILVQVGLVNIVKDYNSEGKVLQIGAYNSIGDQKIPGLNFRGFGKCFPETL